MKILHSSNSTKKREGATCTTGIAYAENKSGDRRKGEKNSITFLFEPSVSWMSVM